MNKSLSKFIEFALIVILVLGGIGFISKFTNNYAHLLVSVNVASLGLIFSSLSGVIAMKEYIKVAKKENFDKKHGTWYYIGRETLFNVVGAIILVPLSYLTLLIL